MSKYKKGYKRSKYNNFGNIFTDMLIKQEKDWSGEEIFNRIQKDKKRRIGR